MERIAIYPLSSELDYPFCTSTALEHGSSCNPRDFSITQVLQRSMDMELELTGVGGKVGAAAGQPVAKLSITGLASTPVDHDTKNNNTLLITGKTLYSHYYQSKFSNFQRGYGIFVPPLVA